MPETMVEKVARAISAIGSGSDSNWSDYTEEARAALQALREPTEAMADAFDNMKAWDDDDRLPEAREAMEAFIDAALSEGAER